jgi:hypothetical protein
LQVWKGIYWSTFILTWLVLPIVFSYLESGYFTPRDRILDALRDQLRMAFIALVALVGFCIYLVAQRYTLAGAEGLLMALGNTYGLLFVVVLLGNGLVEVPRKLWKSSFPDQELKRLYFRSSLVDSDLHDAVCVLSDVEAEVSALREQLRQSPPAGEELALELDACMKILQDTRASFRHRPEDMTLGMLLPRTPFGVNSHPTSGPPPSLAHLAGLHARLKKAQLRVQVLKKQRDAVISKVEVIEAVCQGALPYPSDVKAGDGEGCCAALGAWASHLGTVLAWYWLTTLSHCTLRLLAILGWFLTVCFLWSQVFLGSPYALSPYGAFQQAFGTSSPFAIQLAIAVPLAYVSICTYRSLFKFKLFGYVAIYSDQSIFLAISIPLSPLHAKRRGRDRHGPVFSFSHPLHTPPPSPYSEFSLQGPHQSLAGPLLVNAQYLIRLQFPLAYNFLLMLRSPSSKQTAFRHLMSNMAVVPLLGRGFSVYAPLMMVVLAAFTYFRGYARLLRLVGAYHEDLISGEEQEEMIQQGRSLARRRRYPLPSAGGNNRSGREDGFASGSVSLSGSGGGGKATTGTMRVQQELPPGPLRGSTTAYTQLKT